MAATVTIEKQGHVTLIGLDRAAKMNSFNLQMLRDLAEAFTQLEEDSDAWCGLLFGHGDHFTSGLDLAEVGPAVAGGAELFPADAIDPLDLREPRRSKPVVCAVQGWCITIGVELSLACDIRIAADNTRFRQMEVNRGIMPFGGATLRFPQIAGWGNAMRYLLTGEELDPAEALRIGLIQEIAPAGQQLDRALAVAEKVVACAPLAVRATRTSARVALEDGRAAALETMLEQARALMKTEDAMEGVRSFLERREARFRGK